MIIGRNRFNIYLLLSCAALLAGGCSSTDSGKEEKPDKLISTLRIHPEATEGRTDFSIRVPVNRVPPVLLTVDKEPFLTEADVTEARVVEVMGGFDLLIQFDHHGSLLLEQFTTSNPGRRFAIFSLFGKSSEASRWIAAPAVTRRITSGTIQFTPDATRAETERLALGLNNVAKQIKERNKW